MNIALIGFRGAGKTTVCKLLASELDKNLISMDEEFLKTTKLNTEKFIKRNGLDKFLELETAIIERISNFDDCVFDTTHSIVMRNENIINLKRNSLIIFLTSDQKTLISRIKSKPNFAKEISIDDVKRALQSYESRYKNAADYTIDTSRLSPQEVCNLIAHFIQMELQ